MKLFKVFSSYLGSKKQSLCLLLEFLTSDANCLRSGTPQRHRGLLQGEGLSTSTTCLLSNTGVWNTTGIVVTLLLLVNPALYHLSLHSPAISFSICYPNFSYTPNSLSGVIFLVSTDQSCTSVH